MPKPKKNSTAPAVAMGKKPRNPKRTRAFHGCLPPPDESPVATFDEVDGVPVAIVPVYGKYGAGEKMVLDANDWLAVAARYVEHWVVDARGLVCSSRRAATTDVEQPRAAPKSANLARLLLDAPRGAIVRHVNGNPLDLRRDNLILIDGAARRRAYRHWKLEQDYLAHMRRAERTAGSEI